MSIGRTVPAVTVDAVSLQWANGKTQARMVNSTARFGPFVGFHIEIGKDEDLDRRLQAMRTAQIEIKHQRDGGTIVHHWSLGEAIRFYPVTSGPPADTIAGCLRNTAASAANGIGVRWPDGERSKLAVRGYVDALIAAGYVQPVQLAVRSRMTDVLLACLLDHGRVCEAADGLVDRARHPDVVSFHEIALPLVSGEEAEWGRGDTATVVPFRSDHPETVDADYLLGAWRPSGVHAAALRDWASITTWAADYSAGVDAPQHPEETL